MTNKLTKNERSINMSKVKSKDTDIEMIIRRELYSKGFRYRLHAKLPGHPDIVLSKYRAVIFVHGCFWHRHSCTKGSLPGSNVNFWKKKLNRNKKRDTKNIKLLKQKGWYVEILWECQIKNKNIFREKMKLLVSRLKTRLKQNQKS